MVAVMTSRTADPSFDDKLLCMWIEPCLFCGSAKLNHCKRENVLESQGSLNTGAFHIHFLKLDFSAVAKMLIDERQLMKLLNECELIGASEAIGACQS
jgi:hypothetical protein